MKYGSLVMEKKDFVMIKRNQHLNQYIEDYAHKDALDHLEENMSTALIYDLEDIPDDVIRMYSLVTLSCESGRSETFQLVLPFEVEMGNGKISVQSTLGASVIGRSEGDRIRYGLPANIMTIKIEKVEQSEKHFKVDIPEDIFNNVLPQHFKNSILLNI